MNRNRNKFKGIIKCNTMLIVSILLAIGILSVIGAAQVSPGVSYVPDCNDPDAHSPTCIDLAPTIKQDLINKGYPYYLGHDEPSIKFISKTTGSANNMQWKVTLPTEPTPKQDGSQIANFELYPAFWFSLSLCDPNSFPFGACTPNSDTNVVNSAGSALLELQFYPPGSSKFFVPSSSATQWAAQLTIDSSERSAACSEPINFIPITTNGKPGGSVLQMNNGDTLLITIKDTTDGLETDVNDLTTGQSGSMVASSGNGFFHTDPDTCAKTAFSFHPEYSTASSDHGTPWTSLGANVNFAFETGHFELCGDAACTKKPDNDADDSPDQTILGIGGSFNVNDNDLDGIPYNTNWPDGNAVAHPTTLIIGAPDDNGVGPLSFDGTNYNEGYNQIHFQTTVGFGSVNFYPFYSQAGTGVSCRFNFGNDIGTPTTDFGKTGQYGTTINNPCLSGKFDYTLSAIPSDITVLNGGTASYSVTATLASGSSTSVSLGASGLPSGASASFSPASISPTIGGTSSTLNVATISGGGLGDFPLTIQGTGGGVSPTTSTNLHTFDTTVVVSPTDSTVLRGGTTIYTATLTLVSGSTNTGIPFVSLTTSGLPSDATKTFPTGSFIVPTLSGASTQLFVKTASPPSGSLGDFGFSIIGTDPIGGATRSGTANLRIYDFDTGISSAETVLRGGKGIYTLTLKLISGSSATGIPSVDLSTTAGAPSDSTSTYSPISLTPTTIGATSQLTMQTGSTSLGDFTFTVTGNDPRSEGGSRTVNGGLHIYDFGLTPTPSILQILTTGSNSYSIAEALTSGSSVVNLPSIGLSVSGLPSGATGIFTPISGSALGFTSILGITTVNSPSGTDLLTVTGTDARSPEGGIRTTSPTLDVLTPQQALQLIINQVNTFQSSGVLNKGQANSLIVKLQNAIDELNSVKSKTACNDLGAFVNEVNAYVKAGILTQAQANLLLSGPLGVLAIEAAIPC